MSRNIIENYYYIIKVVCDNGRRTYYKIGETNTKNRPNKLVEKYTALRKNDAELLAFETLPHNDKKRLNDKTIHTNINSAILKSVDPMIIKGCLNETDGITEFFELADNSVNVVEYIANLVNSIKKSDYTANVYEDITLEYKDQYHLVNSDIINALIAKYPEAVAKLYSSVAEKILLIGQFDFTFIASIAMTHEVTIWHDSVEQKHDYPINIINNKITYINSFKELLMTDKTDFDIIISNPPYGKIGNTITELVNKTRRDGSIFINLMPLKDYSLSVGQFLDMNSIVTMAPHSFGDADILTHMVSIKKPAVNNFASERELCANSFTVDKPFIKFMKANELRYHYAIDNIHSYKSDVPLTKSFIFSMPALHSQHTCGLESINSDTVSNDYNFNRHIKDSIFTKAGNSNYKAIVMNSEIEVNNFIKFYKENRNFINRMIANQFIAIRDDAACFPKVDWSKSDWTIEKILKEVASYSDEEVKAVIDTMNIDYAINNDNDIDRLFGAYL